MRADFKVVLDACVLANFGVCDREIMFGVDCGHNGFTVRPEPHPRTAETDAGTQVRPI